MKFKTSIVAFYDILGFGEYIEANKNNPQKIHDLFHVIAESATFDEGERVQFGQRFIHFSDTFVRTTPIFNDSGQPLGNGTLAYEILSAIHIQMGLVLREEVFLRGSITHGDILHTDTEIFGPALVSAYKLETDIAVFPRIIVDPVTIKAMRDGGYFSSTEIDNHYDKEFCETLLRQGDDGVWYVDYLYHARDEFDEPESYFPFLLSHRKMIVRGGNKAEKISKCSQKYTWLAKYHNDIVSGIPDSSFSEAGFTKKNFFITNKDIPINHRA